jgi:hypothetical protein
MSVLKVSGLLHQQGNMLSPLFCAWEDLFEEFKLDDEITTFSISGKQRIFIYVGSWSHRHPSDIPKIVCKLPKLCICTLTMAFASSIGKADIPVPILPCSADAAMESSNNSSDHDNESVCDTSISDGNQNNVSTEDITSFPDILFDANQFPLLNSLCVQKEFQFNKLLGEIVKYKGGTKCFIQYNNTLGFLVLSPLQEQQRDAVLNY